MVLPFGAGGGGGGGLPQRPTGSGIFYRGQTADAFLHVGGLVGHLPRVPGMHGLVEVLKPIGGAWEGARIQHCVCFNEQKGLVCDGNFPIPCLDLFWLYPIAFKYSSMPLLSTWYS